MKILRGLGFKIGFPRGKETAPNFISLWEPPLDDRRRLVNVFADMLERLPPEQQTALTKEELEQKFAEFKRKNPLVENEYRGYLDLYSVFVEAGSRAIEQRSKILTAGGEIPQEDVSAGRVEDIFYRIYDDDQSFWPL